MHKTLNPIVDWKKYFNDTNPIITKYISKYGRTFIVQTIDKIKKAHLTNQSKIIIIKFRDSDIISILEKKDYAHALELLLNLCIKIEYYEVCAEIQKLITDIKLNKKVKKRKRKIKEVSHNPFF
jgi:uncharacterized protein (DUF1330 family)